MQKTLISLIVLLFCIGIPRPVYSAAKFDTKVYRVYPLGQTQRPNVKKGQHEGFLKRALHKVFPKKKLRQKASSRRASWFSFGIGALFTIVVAYLSIFVAWFWVLGIIAWAATIVLGIVGLIKDDNKAMAIVALSLALVLPIVTIILFALSFNTDEQ